MIRSIDRYFPAGTKRTSPDGGFYVWVSLPEELDAKTLISESVMELGICYGIGATFYSEGNPVGAGRNCIRMNFSGLDEKTIEVNVRRLGEFFKDKQKAARLERAA